MQEPQVSLKDWALVLGSNSKKKILFGDVFMSPKSLKTTFLPWFHILENDRELNLQHHFQWESRSYVKRLGDGMTEGFCDLIEHTMWQASCIWWPLVIFTSWYSCPCLMSSPLGLAGLTHLLLMNWIWQKWCAVTWLLSWMLFLGLLVPWEASYYTMNQSCGEVHVARDQGPPTTT